MGYVLSGVYGPPGKRGQSDESDESETNGFGWEYFKRTPVRYFKRLDKNTILIRQTDGYDDVLDGYFKKSADKQPSLDETFAP